MDSRQMAETAVDDLAIALKAVVTGKASSHLFEVGQMTLPNGQKWRVTIAVLSEPITDLIEPLITTGVRALGLAYMKAGLPASAPPPDMEHKA